MKFSSHFLSRIPFSSSYSSSPPLSPNPSKTLILQNLLKSGFSPTLQTLNLFLSFLLRAQKYQLVLHVFSQISSNSIGINPHTHSAVARALLKSNRFEEAEHFITRAAEKFHLSPRKCLWDSLIRGVCVAGGNPEMALSLLHECVGNFGITPSPHTFRSLVFSLCAEGKMDRAIEVLEVMTDEKVGYPFDNYVCSSIISGFCKVGKPEMGLGFYENVEKTLGFLPNLMTYTAVLDALCRDGRIDEVPDLVRRMEEEGVVADAVLYGSWVSGYLRNGILEEALRKHKLMVESGIKPDTVSYTILIDGFCREGNAEKAIGFLSEMEKNGLEPNLVTYTAILQGFCKRGKLEEAMSVLRELEEHGIRVDEFAYSTLIDGFCRKGDLDVVFRLLEEMERNGIEAGIVTYNTVINGLCKVGKMCEADDISRVFCGDNITYSTLLHGYLKEMNVAGVLETKRRVDDAGICMDVVMCNILIKAFFMLGLFEDACLLFRGMPEMGLVADSVTYCTVVDGYCKLGMIDEALEVFDEYRLTSLVSNVVCHSCIIRGLCKKGMSEIAIEVFHDLILRDLIPDSVTYRMLIKTEFKKDNGEGVLKLLHVMEELEPHIHYLICNDAIAFLCNRSCCEAALDTYILMRRKDFVVTSKSYYVILKSLIRNGNKQLFQLMLNACLKEYGFFEPRIINISSLYLCKKDVQKALNFLNEMGKKNITISVSTTVVDSLKKAGRIQDAYKFVMDAGENGAAIDVVTYSTIVNELCKEGYLEKALDLCSIMRTRGINPNIITYNSVINGLCQQGCLVEAFRLFDSLELNNITPTVITYATLIGALSKEGFLEDANQLFEDMVLKGINPNTHIYNLLINGYCNFGLVEEALKLLLDLEQTWMQPDAFTISAVIKGFCIKGDMEGALGFYTEYNRRGIPLDFLGFIILIEGLCAKGRMEEARTILRDMLHCQPVTDLINKAGDEIDEESLVSLLGLLCEQGRMEDAISVLSEVRSFTYASGRSNGDNRPSKLRKLHEMEVLSEGNEIIASDRGSYHPVAMGLPENTDRTLDSKSMIVGTAELNLRLCKGREEDDRLEDYETLMRKPLLRDFDIHYPIIASLCSKGELQKASFVVKAMLLNSGECC